MYNQIVDSLRQASSNFICEKRVPKHHITPGWNEYVKEAHSEARDAFLMWKYNAKPCFGPIYDIMKTSRARFKYCLRYCKSVENKARADSLANKFLLKDNVSFWRDIKHINSGGTASQASTIGGITGEKNITHMWYKHYKALLNLKQSSDSKYDVMNAMKNVSKEDMVKFDVLEVMEALKSVKVGKSAGLDQLQGEHFKYADKSLSCLLCMLLNCILSHGYMPQKLMETIIVPITGIKDKRD